MGRYFFFLILSLIPPSVFSSLPSHSLSKGSSLSVEKPDNLLISPNSMFTAGFHLIGVNAYCFAIWYTKSSSSSNRTIVWMANRDQPVNGKLSKLSLLKNGNLILTDVGQSIFWATNTFSASSVQLVLYNNGNLVLHTPEGILLWQSFDSPTDTLLPEQPLTRYTRLISSRSQTNFSSGFYNLFFDDNNVLDLVFYGPETSSVYWPEPWLLSNQVGRSRYNDTRIAVFDSLGYFHSTDRFEFWAADVGEKRQRRLTLDFDGNLRLYSLEEMSGNWIVSWQALSFPCRIHGACGPNSLCGYNPGSGRTCSCLPGFKMKNHADWSYGCEPEFNISCNYGENTLLKFPHINFYGYNINILRNITLESCENRCLELCNCKGFIFKFDDEKKVRGCYLKWIFRNGFNSTAFAGQLYLKVRNNFISTNLDPVEEFKLDCSGQVIKQLDRNYAKREENGSVKILLWVASTIGVVEIICIFWVWCFLYRAHHCSGRAKHHYLLAATGFRRFTYAELKKATRGFSEEIGRGGDTVVYKGILSDNRVAAIKRLNEANQGEAEFLAEISTLGRLNHMNLIDIWGYCAEGKQRLLVYEYMENGSLAENLCSNTLDSEKRFEIAVGTAKGLAYLHEECLEWVLHCDVKPHNILLDSNYQPKVADFGLSKILNRGGGGNNSGFSKMRGTRGYIAPEWIFNLPITSKVDVYSYGVVVLEMVTGKCPTTGVNAIHFEVEREEKGLINYDVGKMEILVRVALQCVQEDRDARPTMSQVVEMLLCPENYL